MNSYAKPLIALAVWCASSITLAIRADSSLLASFTPSALLLSQSTSDDTDQPPPCICPCGGEIQCEKGQWAYCKCVNGKCKGSCSPGKKEPLDLAADVVSPIVEKPVTRIELQNEASRYFPILDELLKGKVSTL